MHPVFIQAIYYAIVIGLTFLGMGGLLKGFFWKYVKVRTSFGKYIMVKIRAINRDYYAVGSIDEAFLIYKHRKAEKRIKLVEADKDAFYRSLAITFIDVDETKNAICKANYGTIEGFDAKKYSDLYLRALYRPSLADNREKIMFILIIAVGIIGIVGCYFGYVAYKNDALIMQMIQSVASAPQSTTITSTNVL